MQNATDTHLSLDQIEAALAGAGESPQDNGVLEMIVRRPAVDQREAPDAAELSLSDGLVGDTWAQRPSTSTPDHSPNPEAQVTLINSRVIGVLARDRSRWPLAGDQLYIDLDFSQENLPPGQRLAIGTAVIEVTAKPHTGCEKFSRRYGPDARRFVNAPDGLRNRRRGINARVIQPGTVRVGDRVSKVE